MRIFAALTMTYFLTYGSVATSAQSTEEKLNDAPNQSADAAAISDLDRSATLIPEDAPSWVKELPTYTRAGGIQFPVRVTYDRDSTLSEQEFQEQLFLEVQQTIDEMKIVSMPMKEAIRYFPQFTPKYIAENFIRSKDEYRSESELGAVHLAHVWRRVDIKSGTIEELKSVVLERQNLERLWNVATLGFQIVFGVSMGVGLCGAMLLKRSDCRVS